MAIVKIKLTKKVNNVVNDYYPKTSADNVVYDSNNTVADKINSIESALTAHAVTNKGSAFVSGLYKITVNAEGHVTAATPVTKSDITGLGIPDAATTQTVLTFDNAPAEQSENPVKSSGIYYALAGKISTSAKGVNGGVAELDANGKVPSSQLPSYVDDVLSYNSLSDFPATGEDGKIYIAKDTNLSYRWTGSDYAVISPSLALGNTSSTAYRGDWGVQDRAAIGTLTDLQTSEKNNLVAAINEIKNVLTFDSTPTENSTNPVTSGGLFSVLSGKVDAEANKGLSTNDYTTAEKTKLSGIESGAEANVQSDWNQIDTTADDFIKNKPDLSVYAPATFDHVADAHLSYNNITENGTTYPKNYTLLKNAKDYRLLLIRYYVTSLGGVQLWDYILVPPPSVTLVSTFLKSFDLSGGTLTEYIFGLQFSADGTTITLTYGVNGKVMHIAIWGIK